MAHFSDSMTQLWPNLWAKKINLWTKHEPEKCLKLEKFQSNFDQTVLKILRVYTMKLKLKVHHERYNTDNFIPFECDRGGERMPKNGNL